MSKGKSKFKGCITKGNVFKLPPQHIAMCLSVWTVPVTVDKNERKMDEMKLTVKEITVLKKYQLKVVVRFATKINNKVLEFTEASFMIVMEEKVFADFFPSTFSQLIFKHLLHDGKARPWIDYEDLTSKLPHLKKRYENVPSLTYKKPYVILMQRSGFYETRRRLAQFMRIVEEYEEVLKSEAKVQ